MPKLLELFSGTGSVGRQFRRAGWDVVSLDVDPTHGPDLCGAVLELAYASLWRPGDFDAVWASPPCTEYSRARTTAKTPRNFALADSLVAKAKEIIGYLQPKFWAMENPATGLLKEREVVAGLPYVDVTYCSWGFPYKKPTRIWCSDPSLFRLPPPCCAATPCEEYRRERRHKQSAQRGPSRRGGVTRPSSEDTCSLDQLHSMPPGLCAAIAEAAGRSLAPH